MLLAKKKEGKWETKAYFKHIKCTKALIEKTKQKICTIQILYGYGKL
jgi:hypothetical protein